MKNLLLCLEGIECSWGGRRVVTRCLALPRGKQFHPSHLPLPLEQSGTWGQRNSREVSSSVLPCPSSSVSRQPTGWVRNCYTLSPPCCHPSPLPTVILFSLQEARLKMQSTAIPDHALSMHCSHLCVCSDHSLSLLQVVGSKHQKGNRCAICTIDHCRFSNNWNTFVAIQLSVLFSISFISWELGPSVDPNPLAGPSLPILPLLSPTPKPHNTLPDL